MSFPSERITTIFLQGLIIMGLQYIQCLTHSTMALSYFCRFVLVHLKSVIGALQLFSQGIFFSLPFLKYIFLCVYIFYSKIYWAVWWTKTLLLTSYVFILSDSNVAYSFISAFCQNAVYSTTTQKYGCDWCYHVCI